MLIKQMNMNAVRSHYPPDTHFLEAVSYTHLDVYKRQKDAFGSTGQFTSTVSPLNDLEAEKYTKSLGIKGDNIFHMIYNRKVSGAFAGTF